MQLNKNRWLNELWCGDNIEVLKNIPDESVDLIYIDPPFFSNRHYEVIWGNGAELRSFGDRWKGGIEHYIGWMVERLKELHRVLKPTGSIYVHLDWHAVHYIRVEMDKIFGYENFRNEIIWKRTNAHNMKTKTFIKSHDSILFYSKSPGFKFNTQYLPYGDAQMKRYKKDKKGRLYKAENLTFSTINKLRQFEWRGTKPPFNRSWGASKEQLEKWWMEGKILVKKDGRPRLDGLKVYLDEMKGNPLSTVWDDIARIGNTSDERIGYPTQKPEELLERIIKASTNEGDVVLDAFCGCGTTIAVAEKLNRKWICIDVSPVAVKVMTERLKTLEKKLGKKSADFLTLGLPDETIPQLRHWSGQDFQDFIIEQIDGKPSERKVHDYGIDGFTTDGVPVQVKNSEKIGRNVVDNFQSAIRRVNSKKGKIYAVTFGRGAVEEAARLKNEDGINIELIELKPFLVQKYGDHTHHQ